MNSRTLIFLSVGLNLALFAGLAYSKRSQLAWAPVPVAKVDVPSPAEVQGEKTRSPRVIGGVSKAGQFDWHQVESVDYQKYIANLREIGCPEETIRDIIIADVNKFFFERIEPLAVRAREFKYWMAGNSRAKITAANTQELRSIEREKWALVEKLLGAGAQPDYRKFTYPAEHLGEELTLGFLPDERRAAVREVVDKYAALERDLQSRPPMMMTGKDRGELKRVRGQRQAELAKVMTPQELEEYELRNSSTAETLRTRLAGYQPTEDQFRQMFRAQKAYDDEFGGPGTMLTGGAGEYEKRNQAQKRVDEQIKTILGDQVYNSYKRAQDPAYRGIVQVAQENNLPPGTADQVYDIKKAVDQQVRQLMDNSSALPRDQRMAALKAINDETEKTLRQTLGDAGYDAYKQNGGAWTSFVPSDNGGTFTLTSSDGNNMSVRAFRVGDAAGGAPAIEIPVGGSGTPIRVERRPQP